MDATASVRFPYRHFTRRLRRRHRYPAYLYLLVPIAVIPQLAALSWLLRNEGWGDVAEGTRLLWLAGSLVSVLGNLLWIAGLGLGIWASADGKNMAAALVPSPLRQLPRAVRSFLISLTTAIALYHGRVDLAIIASYGGSALNSAWHLYRFHGHTWRDAARIVPSLLVALAILPTSPVLFAAAAILSLFAPVLLKPSLSALLREKRSCSEFLRHERDECG
jgi:hypothetical protein